MPMVGNYLIKTKQPTTQIPKYFFLICVKGIIRIQNYILLHRDVVEVNKIKIKITYDLLKVLYK